MKRPAASGLRSATEWLHGGGDRSLFESSGAASVDRSAIASELRAIVAGLEVQSMRLTMQSRLTDYSILMKVPVEQKKALVEKALTTDYRLDRAMGSMCGMGVGDAVGHMYEFLPCTDEPDEHYFDLKTLQCHKPYNRFRLQLGQWTDDASMGLCMADSMIVRQCYDGSDIRMRFWSWWERGYNNAFRLDQERGGIRSSVGLGGNISKSLADMDHLCDREEGSGRPSPTFRASGEDAGNGSLMRFTPLALFFHSVPSVDLFHYAAQSSFTTHPGVIAAEACSLLAHIIVSAIKRPNFSDGLDPKAFLDQVTAEYAELSGLDEKCKDGDWRYNHVRWLVTGRPERSQERCWRWREPSLGLSETLRARGREYNGYPVSEGYFGSYSLDGLAIALWAVYNTTSFDEAVVKSINVLGDADSHGSICGQIAGALYGYRAINPKFLEWLNRWDEHEFAVRAVLLHEMGRSLGSPA